MRREIAEQWINTIPKYKKGTDCLRDLQDNYCCFGVLCVLFQKAHNLSEEKVWLKGLDNYSFYVSKDTSDQHILPVVVQKWAGMKSILGNFFDSDGKLDSLINRNDNNYTRS